MQQGGVAWPCAAFSALWGPHARQVMEVFLAGVEDGNLRLL